MSLRVKILQRGGVKRHATLEHWTRQFLAAAIPGAVRRGLGIRIEVRATTLDDDLWGEAYDVADPTPGGPEYLIRLRRDLPLDTLVFVLLHELQHVVQFVTGALAVADNELDLCAPPGRLWCRDAAAVPEYWDWYYCTSSTPWEIEADEVAREWRQRYRKDRARRGFSLGAERDDAYEQSVAYREDPAAADAILRAIFGRL